MRRYFFNVGDHRDEEGTVLADEDAAWEEAVAVFAELVQLDGMLRPGQSCLLQVTDDDGEEFCTLRVAATRRSFPTLK